jgi:hypothetical protein
MILPMETGHKWTECAKREQNTLRYRFGRSAPEGAGAVIQLMIP